MSTQYLCKNEQRRAAVRAIAETGKPRLNGIDYLEVSADQKTLLVYFIHPLVGSTSDDQSIPNQTPLKEENLQITGGIRLQQVQVESVSAFTNILMVRVNRVGDFSTYTLRLVGSASTLAPPIGFDPQLAQVDFSFWVEEFSEFDCKQTEPLPEKLPPPPVIDYLAKDYASFRRLMLDRLAITAPVWKERNPSDLAIMLVELMAYAADHLSYYQDAVATEAYLGTARKRVSIRRHVRLLDYLMHDGCNARAWVVIQLKEPEGDRTQQASDGITLLGPSREQNRTGIQFFTQTNLPDCVLTTDQVITALNAGAQVFESLEDVTLHYTFNQISFYTWGNGSCSLPQGSTEATLVDADGHLHQRLNKGSILILEEVKGPRTGDPRDANPKHRHAVRLTQVQSSYDPLNGQMIVQVAWAVEDALPFALVLSALDAEGKLIAEISVARGNVVLVDAGRSQPLEDLRQNPGWENLRPRLRQALLTQQGYVQDALNQWVVFDRRASAHAAMAWQLRDARPAITLWEGVLNSGSEAAPQWQPQRDLLVSDRFARDFVVETEEDGWAYLRFGNDVLGKQPQPDIPLYARYRTGNGVQGNVGAEAIAHLFLPLENLDVAARQRLTSIQASIQKIRNPLPGQGGMEPESIEQVRLYAPQAFREQQRAVTTADYETMAQRYPGVRKALATRRWTGSWHTIFITVDREGGRPNDEAFKQGLLAFLEEFRLTGHDIEIDNPRYVPLDIAITVQLEPDYFRGSVKQALLDAFSNRLMTKGQVGEVGFFEADRFTFGQSVYLSQVVAAAVQISGVRSARVTRFKRWGEPDQGELAMGQIPFERLEIARLDNDPSSPENGRIEFNLEGGL